MELGIAGKVAMVSGGSKGMGRAAAETLGREGCKVAVIAREQSGIDDAVASIARQGGQAIGISADMATAAGIAQAVGEVNDRLGAPDIVVSLNNDFNFGAFDDSRAEVYEEVFRTLTLSQVTLAQATIPEMRRKRWGRFIHIGSLAGKEAQFEIPHIYHNTIRPSTVGFLRTLAQEVGPYGVTVNALGPGLIKTPSFDYFTSHELGFTPEETVEWLAGRHPFPGSEGRKTVSIPLQRAGTMDEFGAVVAFLASNLGGYITGEWIAVDGGLHTFTF
jgi:NAD(P)-dependent dehydrogenase (short-subunit alcohol dehydrogenase family)